MFREVVILGGGVSGAICAYYLDKSLLISEVMGGQVEAKFPMGPRYLHNKPEIKSLLEELKLPTDIKKIKVGYYSDGKYVDEIDKKLKNEYYRKSRGFIQGRDIQVPESVLSDGLNNFEVFTTDMKEFYQSIISTIDPDRIIHKRIEKIDGTHNVLFSDVEYFIYGSLINTIPKDIFTAISSGYFVQNVFNPVTYLFAESNFDLMGYDYVYFPEISSPAFHRITKVPNGLVFDFQGVLLHSEALYEAEKFMGVTFSKSDISKNARAQIVGSVDDYFKHIIHVGRFAELNHSIKVEDVIGRARQIKQNI